MAMVADDMATILKDALGFASESNTTQIIGVAQSIIDEFAVAIVSHSPGSVVGTAPPSGGSLIGGTAIGGTILGMTGASLASRMVSNCGFPSITAQLSGWCDAMVAHFLIGLVNFSTITGTCSNTPTSPGVLIGEGSGGLIAGYNGNLLASQMATGLGQPSPSSQLLQMATGLVAYIQTNAEATYSTGSVTGTCSAGGGPIIVGAAVGGSVT